MSFPVGLRRWYGAKVVGSFSRHLHDGVNGLYEIQKFGGTTIVQDPIDAEVPLDQKASGLPQHVEQILTELGKPLETLAQARSSETEARLEAATDDARQLGLFGSPTFAIGREIFWGDDLLEDAPCVGTDCRDSSCSPRGLIEARRLFAPIPGAGAGGALIGNNCSLVLIHDAVLFAPPKSVPEGTASGPGCQPILLAQRTERGGPPPPRSRGPRRNVGGTSMS